MRVTKQHTNLWCLLELTTTTAGVGERGTVLGSFWKRVTTEEKGGSCRWNAGSVRADTWSQIFRPALTAVILRQ